MDKEPVYAIIVALLNEEDNIPALFERLERTFLTISGQVQYWFVNDGSTDGSARILNELASKNKSVNVIHFSRNFGHHTALFAGIDHADEADRYIIMDADLQDQPEEIPKLIKKMDEGFELVYAIRDEQKHGFVKRCFSRAFWWLINAISAHHYPPNQAMMRLFSRKVRDAVVSVREQHKFIDGIFSWVGFRHAEVTVEHVARYKGQTKYTIGGLFKLAADAITAFSIVPLRAITYGGIFVALTSFLFGLLLIAGHVLGHTGGNGWTSLMVSIFFALGVQLISLGIIAEYVGKLFQQSKDRPDYIVDVVVRGKDE